MELVLDFVYPGKWRGGERAGGAGILEKNPSNTRYLFCLVFGAFFLSWGCFPKSGVDGCWSGFMCSSVVDVIVAHLWTAEPLPPVFV